MSESGLGGPNSDSDPNDKEFPCPTCDDLFSTHWGRVQHRRRGHGEDVPKYPELADKEWLYEKYWGEMLSSAEIADTLGCGEATPREWLRKQGIPTRNGTAWGSQLSGGLPDDAEEILEGELLGDGSIRVRSDEALTAPFRLGTASKEYRDWLADLLKSWGFTTRRREVTTSLEGYGEYQQYRIETVQYVSLQRIGRKWYPEGDKNVPESFTLTPLSLRHWYLGDGSRTGDRVMLHTEGFTPACRKRLIEQLAVVGVRATAQAAGSLLVWKDSHDRFFEYMADIPSELEGVYGYKWP